MRDIVDKKLIFESFDGKATAIQKKRIDEWVLTAGNKELFFQWLQEWENNHLQYIADTDAGLQRYQQFLTNSNNAGQSSLHFPEKDAVSRVWFPGKWLLRIAAGFTVFFLLWKNQSRLIYYTFKTGYDQKKVFLLEDGSKVALNSNSTLLVPRFYLFTGERNVKLEGEALFSVQHTKDDKKFVVATANDEQVVVLGTEFNLYSRNAGTRVVLQKGKVELHYRTSGSRPEQLTMKPGELAAVSREGVARVEAVDHPVNSSEWLHNRYVFEESSVAEVSEIFKDNFGIDITTSDPKIASMTLSGAYTYDNAEDLLMVITQALNLHLIRVNDSTFLLAHQPSM